MAQAVRAAAGTAHLVQRQQHLVGPVWLPLGRIAITDFSDEECTVEKLRNASLCSQTTKEICVLQLLEWHISQLHNNQLCTSMELTVSYRTG